jgi:hypothetical protein
MPARRRVVPVRRIKIRSTAKSWGPLAQTAVIGGASRPVAHDRSSAGVAPFQGRRRHSRLRTGNERTVEVPGHLPSQLKATLVFWHLVGETGMDYAGLARRAACGDKGGKGRARRDLRSRAEGLAGLWSEKTRAKSRAARLARQRALTLQNYFIQPFYCAEPWTKFPSAVVGLAEALCTRCEILDGRHDDVLVEQFYPARSLSLRAGSGSSCPILPLADEGRIVSGGCQAALRLFNCGVAARYSVERGVELPAQRHTRLRSGSVQTMAVR